MPKTTSATEKTAFKRYSGPSYTMVPDELFDDQLAELSGAELKVLLYIMRRTFGFKKETDDISLNQICRGITTKDGRILDRGTGLSQSTVVVALKGLIEANVVMSEHRSSAERGHEATTYRLNVVDPLHRKSEKPPSPKIGEALHRKSDTQYTVIQKTDKSISKYSKAEASVSKAKEPIRVDRKHRGLTSISAVLARRNPVRSLEALVKLDPQIADLISSWSAEWSDTVHIRSNLTQVRHIQEASGWTAAALLSVLHEAHATTNQDGRNARNKAAYFFAVLKDLTGVSRVDRGMDDVKVA